MQSFSSNTVHFFLNGGRLDLLKNPEHYAHLSSSMSLERFVIPYLLTNQSPNYYQSTELLRSQEIYLSCMETEGSLACL